MPLLIGGAGERVTLRRVAEYADMCNLETKPGSTGDARTPEDVRRKLAVLRGHCQAIGRPYESMTRSHFQNQVVLAPTAERAQRKHEDRPTVYRTVQTPRQLIEYYRPYLSAGIQYLIVNLAAHDDVETVELLSTRVMPIQELAGLTGG